MSEVIFAEFTQGESNSTFAIVAAAALSMIALLGVLLRVLWVAITSRLTDTASHDTRESTFFGTPLGLYTASMLLGNMLSSVAGILEIEWSLKRGIWEDSATCGLQARLQMIGDLATAYFTVSVAWHAFNGLVRRKRLPVLVYALVHLIGWLLAVVIGVIIPNAARPGFGPVYGDNGSSCGVTGEYPKIQFAVHLLPTIMTALLVTILYASMFLVLRGTLKIKGGISLNFNPSLRWTGFGADFEEYQQFMGTIVKTMLWYPIAYICLSMPSLFTRLVTLSGNPVSFGVGVFASICGLLTGLANVIILYKIIRVLRPAINASATSRRLDSEASFTTPEMGSSPIERPVSVRPVSMRPKAFPPPRKSTDGSSIASSRFTANAQFNDRPLYNPRPQAPSRSITHQKSSSALSTESTRHLLPDHPGAHRHTSSIGSGVSSLSAASLNRPITPLPELSRAIAVPPRVVHRKPVGSIGPVRASPDYFGQKETSGLPPPPRPPRPSHSPLSLTSPSMSSLSPMSSAEFSTVDIDAPVIRQQGAEIQRSRQSNLTLRRQTSVYGNSTFSPPQTSVTPAWNQASRPSISAVTQEPGISSPISSASSYSDTSDHLRTRSEHDVPESSGQLSPLAWAMLVANAATTDVAGKPLASFERQHVPNRLEQLDAPPASRFDATFPQILRPGTPLSATHRMLPPMVTPSGRGQQSGVSSSSFVGRAMSPVARSRPGPLSSTTVSSNVAHNGRNSQAAMFGYS